MNIYDFFLLFPSALTPNNLNGRFSEKALFFPLGSIFPAVGMNLDDLKFLHLLRRVGFCFPAKMMERSLFNITSQFTNSKNF